MKKWLCICLLTPIVWARPGLSAAEVRALSQQHLTYRQACQQPHDHVFEQLLLKPEQFEVTDLRCEASGIWSTLGRPGQALYRLPASLRGRVLQVHLEATFMRGEMGFFTADEQGQPLEEILTYHVPGWEQDCDHALTHRLRVMSGQALLIRLPAHSKTRIHRLLVQALN